MRQFDGDIYKGLKTAFRRLVRSFGKFEAAAMETRVNSVSLNNYCSLNVEQEKSHAPVDVAIDLMRASGDTVLLEYMAGLFGKILVDAPDGNKCHPETKVMHLAKDMADSVSLHPLQDGRPEA